MNAKSVVLIGYSGHAFVVCDVFISMKKTIIGYFDSEEKTQNPFNLAYFGSEKSENRVEKLSEVDFFIAIGDNKIRRRVTEFLVGKYHFQPIFGVHETAYFATTAKIGHGSIVFPNATVNPLAQIGAGCIINSGAVVEHECVVGDFAHLAPSVVLCGNVQVGENSFIGANSVVKQGISIGKNVVIGAGSVVLKNLPDDCTAFGNPAKIIQKH
jgi:sugar O-acyltransferase (sialic acid O-acetyltransferase NeuD family)